MIFFLPSHPGCHSSGIYRGLKFSWKLLLQRPSSSNARSAHGKYFQDIILIVAVCCLSISCYLYYRTSMNDLLVNTPNLLLAHEAEPRMLDEPELGYHVSRPRMSRLCG